jgi:hypothetical protein
MKKNNKHVVYKKRHNSYELFLELKESEREFTQSMEEHWDLVVNKSSLQQSVLRSAQRIKLARKILHVFGDTPKLIH